MSALRSEGSVTALPVLHRNGGSTVNRINRMAQQTTLIAVCVVDALLYLGLLGSPA